ncbi:hypothetical protein [Stenotrophomonas sp. JAI102]|uniref:hypothetical protein n=1 Tax=Stenotrophomonas sp. JAI102 TaxID=2723077 RepID=UPI0015CA8B96|nr:hypothetical protein [Stenotrophomonas sp. JAI102]NYF35134.1 hypothetical protein [Stenotrophomonas sp. JAI102]
MNVRPEIQVQLDALAEMLVHWVAQVRHPAQFWPQFEMLAGEILDQCAHGERDNACACIQAMLKEHALELPAWHERDESVPPKEPGA